MSGCVETTRGRTPGGCRVDWKIIIWRAFWSDGVLCQCQCSLFGRTWSWSLPSLKEKKNPQGEWLWTETRSLSSGQWCHGSPAHSDELLPFGCDLFFCLVYNTEEENKDVMLRCRSSVPPLWSSTDSSLPQRQIAQEACVGTNLCLVYSWKWYMFFPICKLHLTLIKWL